MPRGIYSRDKKPAKTAKKTPARRKKPTQQRTQDIPTISRAQLVRTSIVPAEGNTEITVRRGDTITIRVI